jgi:hypothetical protein
MSWRGLDHRTIYEMVVNGGKGTGMSIDAEQRWAKVQQTIADAERAIATAVGESRAGWEGVGAEAMEGAYTPLGAWALDAAASAQMTAVAVRDQGQLAFETRRLVMDNAPPHGLLQEAHAVVGTWDDGRSVYDDQADAVDRLMTGYHEASQRNAEYFDRWSVPPTVAVGTASAAPGGAGGAGIGAMPDTAAVAPAGGSTAATTAAAPGPGAGAAVLPTAPVGVAAGGAAAGSSPGGAGAGGAGAGGTAAGGAGAGAGVGAVTPGAAGFGGASGTGSPTGRGAARGPGVPGRGIGTGSGTGGLATPSIRPPGAPGGRGTGAGPWTRAATGIGGFPAGTTPPRPVVPSAPPRTSVPEWRSVLLPPERETAAVRPGAPGGSTAPGAAAGPPTGTRAGSPGVHAPMMGMGGGGGGQGGGERRRPSYLVDDSDAFVDRRWVQPAVITPEDLVPDEHGRYPGQ